MAVAEFAGFGRWFFEEGVDLSVLPSLRESSSFGREVNNGCERIADHGSS